MGSAGIQTEFEAEMENACWICMGDQAPLQQPCGCPRLVHPECLARWQLHSAGKDEEQSCRFCKQMLPEWQTSLGGTVQDVRPTISIEYGGKVVFIKFHQKPQKEHIYRAVRSAFGIPDDVPLHFTFDCCIPGTADTVQLEGEAAFPAAMHCASISAYRRKMSQLNC